MHSPTFFSSLQHELLLEILKKLPVQAIIRLGITNKRLEKVTHHYLFNHELLADKNKKINLYTRVLSTNQFNCQRNWEALNDELCWIFYQSPHTLFKSEKKAPACFEVKLSFHEIIKHLKDIKNLTKEKNYILRIALPKESIQAAYIPNQLATGLTYQENPYAKPGFSFNT